MLVSEYNWIITPELANQRAPKALFICVVYTDACYLASKAKFTNKLSFDRCKLLKIYTGSPMFACEALQLPKTVDNWGAFSKKN